MKKKELLQLEEFVMMKILLTGTIFIRCVFDLVLILLFRVLFGYEGQSNVIVVVGTGEGGIEEMKQHLKPDSINYGIVRVYDCYDGHTTTKFVLILWVGEQVKIMRKARITTHKGTVLSFLGQYHTDISCSNHNEISQDIIMTKVQDASGTAVHVMEKAE